MKAKRFSVILLYLSAFAFAEGTSSWTQTTYEELSRGTTKVVAVRSDGTLEMAPGLKAIYTSPSTFIWSIASDADGNVYLGTGSPARVYRISAEGKPSVIFEPKELQV